MSFIQGWYVIRTETGGANAGRTRLRFFVDDATYSAECIIEPNGAQILLWSTENPAHYKKAAWSSGYEYRKSAKPEEDWWDDPGTSTGFNPDIPGDYSREQRKPTVRELAQRAATIDPLCVDGLTCSKEIHVGLFFDGTNNNRDRDRPLQGHSNIVSLYDAHREDGEGYFRYYIPGVGTRFREIGELNESSSGKTFAAGGAARIHWAMMSLFNAVCRASVKEDILQEAEMTRLATSTVDGLWTLWQLGDDKLVDVFGGIQRRLVERIASARPKVVRVNLSVFGFSRGAAQARTFTNWIRKVTRGKVGFAVLKVRFVGIFDTVASVGLADSAPIGNGFLDWADGTMEIEGVERGLHYVAAHEIRRSFPLSTARSAGGKPAAGFSEYIYPGAHSDLGGGYSPRDQGKALEGRSSLLSQIPLNDMHFEAMNAGAELLRKEDLEARVQSDFMVIPELDAAFSAYTGWTTSVQEKAEDVASQAKADVDNRMQYHMQLYWRWRASKKTDDLFREMSSYRNASAQDRQDLWEAEGDWRRDCVRARRAVEHPSSPKAVIGANSRALYAVLNGDLTVPEEVDRFFDGYVHDSHAGFWLLGPQTAYDRGVFVNELKAKQRRHEELTRYASEATDPRAKSSLSLMAGRYELNSFEKRVLQSASVGDPSASFPVMTDEDAADLRDNSGMFQGGIVKYVLGTGTRREANGHGQYRRIFDRS